MMDSTRRAVLGAAPAIAAAAGAAPFLAPARAEAAAPAGGKQVPGYYRYKVGELEVNVVTDGAATFPLPDKFVVNVPKEQVSGALKDAHLDAEKITVPFTPVAINTGSRLVVIDTGQGEKTFGPSKGAIGQFLTNLKAAGYDREAVDTVIISHFHGDHVNGLLDADGKPAFPKAEVLVPEKEWAFWMDDGEMSRAPAGRMQDLFKSNRAVFDAIGRKVTPYAWDKEILPGILPVGTPGHTPGHTSYVVSSGGSRIFVQSDVTNVPVLFARHPGWHAAYDQDAKMAEETRRKTYDMIVAEKMMLQGFHYSFPGRAYLEKTADGYREVPAPWSPVV